MKIAVVGSGIAGLAAAWLLGRRHEVVLFEQDARPGGHTNTFRVPGGPPIDTGFIVYNEPCYPNLTGMFAELAVATRPGDMSFGVSIAGGDFEYAGDNLATLFAQRANLVAPRHWRMLLQILAFNGRVRKLLAAGALPGGTLGEFLDRHRYAPELAARYLLPMCGAIWSTSPRAARDFPFAEFARFFDSHGLLNAVQRPAWRTVVGGSRQYVEKILGEFRGEVRLSTRVAAIMRRDDSVHVDGVRFDAAVVATHSDQALALLADADAAERDVLGGVGYAANRAFLHTDATLMPRRRAVWSSWNYLGAADAVTDTPVCVSYWMNRLQGIEGPVEYFVTLNPPRPPVPERVLYDIVYHHPQYTPRAIAAQQRLPTVLGRRRTWFCGAWCGYGFHEDGLRSALRAVQQLDAACLPAWARP